METHSFSHGGAMWRHALVEATDISDQEPLELHKMCDLRHSTEGYKKSVVGHFHPHPVTKNVLLQLVLYLYVLR